MYEQFFGLRDKPFSLTPNPRFVFYSAQYHEAEGQLIYGINNREGVMIVTGQPGTGKTTLCRDLIEKLDRDKSQSALLFNPFLNGTEMLAALLIEFGINVPAGCTRNDLLDRLSQYLLAQLALGRTCVAIFDEAQHLAPDFLEQIRVLSNLETDRERLLQIVLVGQPELLDKIQTPQMSHLDQRVSIRCALAELDEAEVDRYIRHRLDVAGARGQVQFTPRAIKEVYRASHGVPRLINLICDRALLAAYASQTHDIQPPHVRKAIAALRGEDTGVNAGAAQPRRPWRRRAATAAAVALIAAATTSLAFWSRGDALSADEAAYQRTITASSAADAERALTKFLGEHAASKHFDDALLRLAQLEISRGDRAAAIQNLTRLAQHAPLPLDRTRAVVLASQARLDNADTTSACQLISPDLASSATADSALAHQLTAVSSVCASRGAITNAAAAPDTTRPAATRDSVVNPVLKRDAGRGATR